MEKNYNDCGLMIYDRDKQKVFSGGSGNKCPLIYFPLFPNLTQTTLHVLVINPFSKKQFRYESLLIIDQTSFSFQTKYRFPISRGNVAESLECH